MELERQPLAMHFLQQPALWILLLVINLSVASCERDTDATSSGGLCHVSISLGEVTGYTPAETRVTPDTDAPSWTSLVPLPGGDTARVCIRPDETSPTSTRSASLLDNDIRFRVLVYKSAGVSTANFVCSADYVVNPGGAVLLSDDDLMMPAGTYTFVTYSYNTTDPMPAFSSESSTTVSAIPVGTRFAAGSQTVTVGGDQSVQLHMKQLCTALSFILDGTDNITACDAALTGLPATASWTVGSSDMGDIAGSGQSLPCHFPTLGAKTVSSDKIYFFPQNLNTLTLKFNSVTLRGKTGTNLTLALPAGTLQKGVAYTCNVSLENKKIDLSKDGTANCYIVTEDGGYFFNATVRGNNATSVAGINYSTLPDLSTATEARVIWQTGGTASVISSVKLNSGKVEFTLGSATEGNAVIGIFASSAAEAPCLWSWHIWRLNGSAPGTVACVKTPSPATASANFMMMDRNLGAYNNTISDAGAIGLLYQWGRKDPFPGPAGFNETEPTNIYGSVSVGGTVRTFSGGYTLPAVQGDDSNGTEAWAVQYPGVFIYENTDTDWLYTKNNNLWGTPWVDTDRVGYYNGTQGTKSIYDPCPVGYRVPPQDFDSKLIAKGTWNNGMALTDIVSSGTFWFPASGMRWGDSSAGELADGGSISYYWSSSPLSSTSDYCSYVLLYSGSVGPRSGVFRAFGQSVRCVSE